MVYYNKDIYKDKVWYWMLSKEDIKRQWSKTYNTDGNPDWAHIFPYYDDDIIFQDTIQRIEGIDDFTKMCKRLTKRTKSLHMELLHVIQEDNIVMMEWIMTMTFRHTPKTSLYGTTRLTFNQEGKIIEQRDYYDLWGDIYNNVPVWRRIYRWFMRKVFG